MDVLSAFTHYVYPGIYQRQVRALHPKQALGAYIFRPLPQDFHHCGLEPGDDIGWFDLHI